MSPNILAADAERLVVLAQPISPGRGWECSSPITPSDGRLPIANLSFPSAQIDDLTGLLRAR